MATNKTRITFHMKDAEYEKLKVIAEHEMRSLSNIIEYLCTSCIKEYEEKHGEIKLDE